MGSLKEYAAGTVPFAPMLATPWHALPKGRQWVYEEQCDGIRTLAARRDGGVRVGRRSRSWLKIAVR